MMIQIYNQIENGDYNINFVIEKNYKFFFKWSFLEVELNKLFDISEELKEQNQILPVEQIATLLTNLIQRTEDEEEEQKLTEEEGQTDNAEGIRPNVEITVHCNFCLKNLDLGDQQNLVILPCCKSSIHKQCCRIGMQLTPICLCTCNVRISMLGYMIQKQKKLEIKKNLSHIQ